MLDPRLPVSAIRRTFDEQRWAVIDGALEAGVAEAVAASIEALRGEFRLRVRNGVYPKTLTFDAPLSETRKLALDRQLAVARELDLFTYLYWLFEPHPGCDAHAVCALARRLCAPECLRLVGELTGTELVKGEVAGVTRYHEGHYLGPHSDRLAKFGPFRRKVAYILYLSRGWEREMGGLTVHGSGGAPAEIVPAFNRLLLLAVDDVGKHWVTPVRRAGAERIAMPGFFCVPAEIASE
ncbi:2OG-Fe(II) oxygenase [Sorangium sp. So ce1389]|uniref:2OG-Fe(II) oxygenase n=1 Tax=Sorangium sp. So ce1389 TaxID=3133336 RepID=UPI003F6366EE